jgi:hypothetical protein
MMSASCRVAAADEPPDELCVPGTSGMFLEHQEKGQTPKRACAGLPSLLAERLYGYEAIQRHSENADENHHGHRGQQAWQFPHQGFSQYFRICMQ